MLRKLQSKFRFLIYKDGNKRMFKFDIKTLRKKLRLKLKHKQYKFFSFSHEFSIFLPNNLKFLAKFYTPTIFFPCHFVLLPTCSFKRILFYQFYLFRFIISKVERQGKFKYFNFKIKFSRGCMIFLYKALNA